MVTDGKEFLTVYFQSLLAVVYGLRAVTNPITQNEQIRKRILSSNSKKTTLPKLILLLKGECLLSFIRLCRPLNVKGLLSLLLTAYIAFILL